MTFLRPGHYLSLAILVQRLHKWLIAKCILKVNSFIGYEHLDARTLQVVELNLFPTCLFSHQK